VRHHHGFTTNLHYHWRPDHVFAVEEGAPWIQWQLAARGLQKSPPPGRAPQGVAADAADAPLTKGMDPTGMPRAAYRGRGGRAPIHRRDEVASACHRSGVSQVPTIPEGRRRCRMGRPATRRREERDACSTASGHPASAPCSAVGRRRRPAFLPCGRDDKLDEKEG
jgi:hypothetical protein